MFNLVLKTKLNKEFIEKFFKLSWPLILSQLIVLLVNNFSIAMMGTLSDKAISGYSVASEAFSIYSMVILGLTGGFHVYIAQYYGDKNKPKYNETFRFCLVLCFITGLLFTGYLMIFTEQFVNIFIKEEAEIIHYAVSYLRIFALTFVPYAMNLLFSGSYSIIGRGHITMLAGTINCILNLVFCYLLIFGNLGFPTLGIQGAAWALVIARTGEMIFLLIIINLPQSDFKLTTKYEKLTGEEKTNIIKTSMPLIFNEILFSIALMFVFINYGLVGEQYFGCLSIVNNVTHLIFVLWSGASTVIGVMIGGELGANRIENAKVNAAKIIKTCIYMHAICCVGIAIFSPFIPRFFSLEGAMYDMAVKMLWVKASVAWLGTSTMTFYNTLRIGGDTKSVFILDGVFTCCGPFLMSMIFARVFQVSFLTLYIVVESMNVFKALLGFYFLQKEKWIHKLS